MASTAVAIAMPRMVSSGGPIMAEVIRVVFVVGVVIAVSVLGVASLGPGGWARDPAAVQERAAPARC